MTEKTVTYRSTFVLLVILISSVLILLSMLKIQFVNGTYYRRLAEKYSIKEFKVPASRGNIFSVDEKLLAVTVPLYKVAFDPQVPGEKTFKRNLDKLSRGLSAVLGQDISYWKNKLQKARKQGSRYVLIATKLDFHTFEKLKNLPIFNKGRYKGGFIYESKPARVYPFGTMLKRTIGVAREDIKYGLEGTYHKILQGKDGIRLKQKINARTWKPLNNFNETEPVPGKDLVTTLNMQFQDIAHHALLDQLKKYEADHGTVVIMEVKTGAIKAMVNLGKNGNGVYVEKYNYAVGEKYEPGSLMKTFTFLAMLEDEKVDTSDVVYFDPTGYRYYDRLITDAHKHEKNHMTVGHALAVSSNIVTVKLTDSLYRKNPRHFVDLIKDLTVDEPTNFEIKGEPRPVVPYPVKDIKKWKPVQLGMMSFGYEVMLTPLQLVTLYNAIANDGKKMKPYIVQYIKQNDRIVKEISPRVLDRSIASKDNVRKIKALLRKVVEEGTARNINSPYVEIAGKTGTSQTEYWTGNTQYIASFAGFFPASNPRYSMIVVVHKPNKYIGYYGNDVAGKVFQRIAEEIYGITPAKYIVRIEK